MSIRQLTNFLLLPKLKLLDLKKADHKYLNYFCETKTKSAFCPKCGAETHSVHDRRIVRTKDSTIGSKRKVLVIQKRRFRCEMLGCKAVFTENIGGIKKRARLTERLQKEILYCSEKFSSLKDVRKHTGCANKTIYTRVYKQLELNQRMRMNTPWPSTIGIDEHSFCKNKDKGYREFATIIIDYNGKLVKELIPGRNSGQLQMALNRYPERENVRNIVMDLSSTYRSFAIDFFPRARIIADKFHVLRPLSPTINKYRKKIEGTSRKDPTRLLLLKSSCKLSYFQSIALKTWLEKHPELKEIYTAKEALHRVYRCNGKAKARKSLIRLMDWLAKSEIPELMTLRKTLKKWINEIVNYFENKITNARTEGFNNVAKMLQKRAYGFKNFSNYRLRLLNVG